MAVEAHHLHLFPPQPIKNREMVRTIENNANLYNTQTGFGITENLIPFYMTCPIADSLPAVTTTNNAADSGLTCNLSTPQKRLREFDSLFVEKDRSSILSCHHPFSFLGEDISLQIHQQQSEIDGFIIQHMKRARMDLSECRQRHAKRILTAVEEGMMKRLKAKEEEMENIGRLNWVLEERVKSLCMENQIWRDLARTSETRANTLRSNLHHVLAQVSSEQRCELAEDAESCCDSSEEDDRLKLVGSNEVVDKKVKDNSRSCRNCGKEEPCVVLLPCRHLCLCNKCGSRLNTCPICNANKNGSVHVNIS